MSETIYEIILGSVVVWPLLLAIPTLHTRVPWSRHLAILPAALLTVLPGDTSLELPWLLFGTGFAIDGEVRWIMLMTVAVWLTTATVMKSSRHDPAQDYTTPLFLLTLAGNLGAVLATDLPGFFCFTTLMGYGFYGLLVQADGEAVRRAGRLYLMFLVVADLLLFEALLLAAFTSQNLQFEVVREAMAGAAVSQLYVWLIIIGFALKAGVWPAHLWLSAAFNSAKPATRLLLGGVPVAMALLGTARCLPLGQQSVDVLGMTLPILGVAIMLYAVFRHFTLTQIKQLPAWSSIGITGLFVAALGTGLFQPVLWRSYEHLIYPFIAATGLLLAVLSFVVSKLQMTGEPPVSDFKQAKIFSLWVRQWIMVFRHWSMSRLLLAQSAWHSSGMMMLRQYQRISDRKTSGGFFNSWHARITMFVLLGLAMAWLG